MAIVTGAFTQSGYPVIADYGAAELDTSANVGGVKFPGGIRAGDVATVLLYVARRWAAEVEPLRQGGCWGYDRRDIRGGSGWSNHAGGCAIDINADLHPQHAYTLTRAQIAAARQIRDDCGGVVRWGGDWDPASVDQMHWEIAPGQYGRGAVAALAARVSSAQGPRPGGGEAPKPTPEPEDDMPFTEAQLRAIVASEVAKAIAADAAQTFPVVDATSTPQASQKTKAEMLQRAVRVGGLAAAQTTYSPDQVAAAVKAVLPAAGAGASADAIAAAVVKAIGSKLS